MTNNSRNENHHSRSDPQQQQQEFLRTVKMLATFWDRMTRLYGHKWISREGEFPANENGHIDKGHPNIYGFRVWFDAVKDLSDEQWRRGVDRIEKNIREKAKIGDESWPPSYEEFIAYATEHRNRAHKYFAPSLPQPPEIRSKRKRLALESLDKIKSMLDE